VRTEERAREIALRSLNAAPRTRHQLTELLTRREVPLEVIDPLLDRFEEVGLINDEEFARRWTQSRLASRGVARRALRQELVRKGVPSEVIESALADIDDDDELAAAIRLATRKLKTMTDQDAYSQRRRIFGMLARRGYSSSVTGMAIDQVLASTLEQ